MKAPHEETPYLGMHHHPQGHWRSSETVEGRARQVLVIAPPALVVAANGRLLTVGWSPSGR
jgi:hypothetical protein